MMNGSSRLKELLQSEVLLYRRCQIAGTISFMKQTVAKLILEEYTERSDLVLKSALL